PKKPLACVEVGPLVSAPIVTTVRPPVPHTGRPARGPVPSTRRLSGWSHETFPFPFRFSRQRIMTTRPGAPIRSRISLGFHGSHHTFRLLRSNRTILARSDEMKPIL